MSHPFGKKNPFLSMWLSGAHSMLARARGQTAAQIRRQGNAAAKKASKDVTDLWANALFPRASNTPKVPFESKPPKATKRKRGKR